MDGFSIGDLQLSNRVLTAPIAGVTGRAFRDILHSQGPGLIYTEMVSAQALCYENIKTFELVDLLGEEKPVGVQLCGSNPQVMAEAAQIIEAMGVDIIDINMGCPAPKVVRNQEGASLMLRPHDAYEIIYRVKKAVKVPVTAKFRSGWDEDHLNCLEFAEILQDAGADALTVHGRTRQQFYSGHADWRHIADVKKAVRIPVIGNGDIFSPQDARRMLEETACDGVMIARGLLGNPWLIGDTVAFLNGQEIIGKPGKADILQLALTHLEHQKQLSVDWRLLHKEKDCQKAGELAAVRAMRSHLAWYIKGMKNAAQIRNRLNQLESIREIEELFALWLADDEK